MSKRTAAVWILVTTAVAPGCSKGGADKASDSDSGTLAVPHIAELVTAALPAGLKPGGTDPVDTSALRLAALDAVTPATDEDPATLAGVYLTNLFQDTFDDTTGYLLNRVSTIDARMSLFDGAPLTGCLANTPKPFHVDMSTIDPILDVTLTDVQCAAPFSATSTQSGEVFGSSGADSSLWVQPSDDFTADGGGLDFANVTDAGSTDPAAPERVNGVAVFYNPNVAGDLGGGMSITRYIATPATHTFEMFYGSSSGVIQSAQSSNISLLGTGFRFISDGTYVYADGTLCNDETGTSCRDNPDKWVAFTACLDASTITPHTPATDCDTLATSFTLDNTGASLTFTEITGDADVSQSYGYLNGTNPGPTAANVALVNSYAQISAFDGVATRHGP